MLSSYPPSIYNLPNFRLFLSHARARSLPLLTDTKLSYMGIVPPLDFMNHGEGAFPISVAKGMFKGPAVTVPGAVAASAASGPSEVLTDYCPSSPSRSLLSFGFVPPSLADATKPALAEIEIIMDDSDEFWQDKQEVLRESGIDPVQLHAISNTESLPPEFVQFLRLKYLSVTDAFLLEAVLAGDCWENCAEPVSEENERAVLAAVTAWCEGKLVLIEEAEALETAMEGAAEEKEPAAAAAEREAVASIRVVRETETRAIKAALVSARREGEALDLKTYYHQRRLKSLNLDSPWNGEEVGGGAGVKKGGEMDW